MDAGFLNVVEIGQYFMTKHIEEFSQFKDAVACREQILPRDEETSEPKGWIRGNTKIGPVLEVTTCCRMQKILYAEQRQKQNHKEGNLLTLHQESFPWRRNWIDIEPGKHSLRVRGFGESDSSSSSLTVSTSRSSSSPHFQSIPNFTS